MKYYQLGVFVFLVLLAGNSTAEFASTYFEAYAQDQVERITVSTPDRSYEEGETIVITGKVSTVIGTTPVTVQIFHEDRMIEVRQLQVAQDGSFTETVLAVGPLWSRDGEYIVRAAYGEGVIAETSFTFSTQKDDTEITDRFEVDAGSSGTFDVDYTIVGGDVKNMKVIPDMFALSITIEPVDDGSITLSLPRDYIDAKKQGGNDESFIILVNDSEVPYEEVKKTSEARTIKIRFDEDVSNVLVIGTYVIPEFGPLSFLIFTVTIGAVIVTMFFIKKNSNKMMYLAR